MLFDSGKIKLSGKSVITPRRSGYWQGFGPNDINGLLQYFLNAAKAKV